MRSIKEMLSLKGCRALITGADGNLGRAFANGLAECGCNLILVDRINSNLSKLSLDLAERWGVQSEIYVCDLEVQDERSKLIHAINSSEHGLNILINNAAFVGTSDLTGWSVKFSEQSVETWRRAFEVNLTAVFELTQGLTPLLKVSRGRILNIASIYGILGPDWRIYSGTEMGNPAAYAASKGGLIQLTRWLATTLAPEIRVNSLSMGGIIRAQPQEFIEQYKSRTPLGRMAAEDDFHAAALFLVSDMSAYLTGQNIVIDGGWSAW